MMADQAQEEQLEQNGVDPALYWTINANGVEWLYLLTRLIKTLPEKVDGLPPAVLVVNPDSSLTYLLHRQAVSSVMLAKITGYTIQEVKDMKELTLRVSRKDLPEPTVNYWGEA